MPPQVALEVTTKLVELTREIENTAELLKSGRQIEDMSDMRNVRIVGQ